MLDFDRVLDMISPLALMRFFPPDASSRLELAKLIGSIASTEEQVEWLVQRTLELCDEWPGPRTLRAIFCKKYKPRNGIDLRNAITEAFPDGIPDEKPIQEEPILALPPGHVASADPQLEAMVHTAAAAVQMPPGNYLVGRREKEFAAFLEEVITAPCDRTDPAPKKATPLPETPPVGPDGQFVQAVVDVPEEPPRKPITQADVNAILAERRKAVQA